MYRVERLIPGAITDCNIILGYRIQIPSLMVKASATWAPSFVPFPVHCVQLYCPKLQAVWTLTGIVSIPFHLSLFPNHRV